MSRDFLEGDKERVWARVTHMLFTKKKLGACRPKFLFLGAKETEGERKEWRYE